MILGNLDIPFTFFAYLFGIVNGIVIHWSLDKITKMFYPEVWYEQNKPKNHMELEREAESLSGEGRKPMQE